MRIRSDGYGGPFAADLGQASLGDLAAGEGRGEGEEAGGDPDGWSTVDEQLWCVPTNPIGKMSCSDWQGDNVRLVLGTIALTAETGRVVGGCVGMMRLHWGEKTEIEAAVTRQDPPGIIRRDPEPLVAVQPRLRR
jgi:hypothetical protein